MLILDSTRMPLHAAPCSPQPLRQCIKKAAPSRDLASELQFSFREFPLDCCARPSAPAQNFSMPARSLDASLTNLGLLRTVRSSYYRGCRLDVETRHDGEGIIFIGRIEPCNPTRYERGAYDGSMPCAVVIPFTMSCYAGCVGLL